MERKSGFFSVLFIITVSACIAFFLAACGGGSDGDSSSISYTGLETLVEIDANNAVDMATGAYKGGSTSGSIGSFMGVIQPGEDGYIARSRSLVLALALEKTFRRIHVNSWSDDSTAAGVIQTFSDTEYGSCGGSVSYTVRGDDVTGNFTGSFRFNNYCEDGTTLSGSAKASGKVDMETEEFIQFSMTFTSLTSTSGTPGDSFTVSGDIAVNISGSPITFAMDMYIRDNSTMKVYWLDDFAMSIIEETDYADLEISGSFYDPDYGYVILSTPTPLRILDVDENPSQGVLIITGDTGIGGGSTKVRLTALSSATCQVEADTDGDGDYDWSSGILNWTEF